MLTVVVVPSGVVCRVEDVTAAVVLVDEVLLLSFAAAVLEIVVLVLVVVVCSVGGRDACPAVEGISLIDTTF